MGSCGRTKESEAETPKESEIEYVGDIWRDKTRPIVLITETEETERPTSDTEEDNIPVIQTLVRKEKEETERPTSDTEEDNIPVIHTLVRKENEIPTGEMCVGKTVLKQFDEGLFKGTVTGATKQRGRYLYHVVYEDGDSEDLNDKEFMKAYDMFKTNNAILVDKSKGKSEDIMSDIEEDKSGGDTEGSEYGLSEEDEVRHSEKKRRTVQQLKKRRTQPQTKKQKPRIKSKP